MGDRSRGHDPHAASASPCEQAFLRQSAPQAAALQYAQLRYPSNHARTSMLISIGPAHTNSLPLQLCGPARRRSFVLRVGPTKPTHLACDCALVDVTQRALVGPPSHRETGHIQHLQESRRLDESTGLNLSSPMSAEPQRSPHSELRLVRVSLLACICQMHMATSGREPASRTSPGRWACHCTRRQNHHRTWDIES